MSRRPHKLELYRLSVQHPRAEADFLVRCYEHHRKGSPRLLREDYAGTAAIATAWVAMHGEHQAMAVDHHGPTLRWAWSRAKRELGPRCDDLHLVQSDVMEAKGPKVDVVAALNFSAFFHHTAASMLAYLKVARAALRPGGMFVMDLFGGPGAMEVGRQLRHVRPEKEEHLDSFDYVWEQRSFDHATSRIDCRIHFHIHGRWMMNAFRYDWRLWTPVEVTELMRQAGFADAALWCDDYDPNIRRAAGVFAPVEKIPARKDFVAYAVGLR